jgi:DNA-binding XRE family transcriptional regulator
VGIRGINEKTIQRHESGKYYPRINILYAITYGFNIDDLIKKVEKIEIK